jgi:hypothetical protein
MENLLFVVAAAMSFLLALAAARFTLTILLRAMFQ